MYGLFLILQFILDFFLILRSNPSRKGPHTAKRRAPHRVPGTHTFRDGVETKKTGAPKRAPVPYKDQNVQTRPRT